MTVPPPPAVGVIGGSGLYSLLDDATDVSSQTVDTPFGPPSEAVTFGTVGSTRVAFLPRHGRDHRFPPHRVPYRANLWALRAVGVRQVLAPSAVGSLRPDIGPGRLLVPDQVVDRTSRRDGTFYDSAAVHVGFADPYCPVGRAAVLATATEVFPQPPVDGGTMVVIEGPRFSSRAESRFHAAQGWSVVGMTGQPEAALARELGLCFTAVSLVTDHDAGTEAIAPVTHQAVLDVYAASLPLVQRTVLEAATRLPGERTCGCSHALDGVDLPFDLP